MAINLVLRLVKGSALTFAELDGNFTALKNAIEGLNPSLLQGNGYVKFAGGLIMQWGGGATITGKADNFTFPIAYPNACFGVLAGEGYTGGWDTNVPHPNANPTIYGQRAISKTGFTISGCRVIANSPYGGMYSSGLGFGWLSLGY
jgi:hypothetical protein